MEPQVLCMVVLSMVLTMGGFWALLMVVMPMEIKTISISPKLLV